MFSEIKIFVKKEKYFERNKEKNRLIEFYERNICYGYYMSVFYLFINWFFCFYCFFGLVFIIVLNFFEMRMILFVRLSFFRM